MRRAWGESSQFPAVSSAGAPKIPEPLLDQLVDGGRMVIPIGDRFSQELIKIVREKDRYKEKNLGGCRFVDLVGLHGWED